MILPQVHLRKPCYDFLLPLKDQDLAGFFPVHHAADIADHPEPRSKTHR